MWCERRQGSCMARHRQCTTRALASSRYAYPYQTCKAILLKLRKLALSESPTFSKALTLGPGLMSLMALPLVAPTVHVLYQPHMSPPKTILHVTMCRQSMHRSERLAVAGLHVHILLVLQSSASLQLHAGSVKPLSSCKVPQLGHSQRQCARGP